MSNVLELAEVVLERTRWKILNSLQGTSKYIGQIAADTELDRSNVAYHLSILEQNGLVNSEYRILDPPHSKGTAARFYSTNAQLYSEFLKELKELISTL